MIRIEDRELEAMVLSRNSCIAVPIEVYKPEDEEAEITVYSCFEAVATEYEALFGDDLFNADAFKWLDAKLYAIAKEFGYVHSFEDIHYLAEYKIDEESQMQNNLRLDDVQIIEDESQLYGIDTTLVDDVIFSGKSAVLIRDGKIIAVAASNDVFFEDNSVEIYVETAADFRCRGYGSAVVSALASEYLKEGIAVRYKCAKNNGASVKIAEKCGFIKVGERYSYVCFAIDENLDPGEI